MNKPSNISTTIINICSAVGLGSITQHQLLYCRDITTITTQVKFAYVV